MRNVIVTEFMSLDGVIENPAWTFPYWNDETAAFKTEEAGDALLLGRVTYEGFAQAWPNSKDEGAAYFNGVRKYVVTTTLDKADWNNSVLIKSNVAEEIQKLKQQDGGDIVVHGSAKLAGWLMQQGLVDRVRLLVYPVVLGKGQRLFTEETAGNFNLVSAKPFSTGVVALVYAPKKD